MPLPGLDQNCTRAGSFYISLSFSTGNLEGELWLTRHPGESNADVTVVRPSLASPSSHPPPEDQGHLGNDVSRTTGQPGRGHWDFAPGQGYSGMISGTLEKKSAEGMLLRSGMAQSLEVWVQKIKRLQFFI